MTKHCQVCGFDAQAHDHTCPTCGEASFVDVPAPAQKPAEWAPPLPAESHPTPAPRRRSR